MGVGMEELPHFDPIEAEVEGHTLKLFVSGQERLQALLDIIEGARSTLRLYFYIFSNDDTAAKVNDALISACNRGVKIWLLIDGFGSGDCGDEVFQPIRDAGVTFCRFYPRYGRRYLLRNHQKMVIADDAVALIGGANVSDAYFADDLTGKGWHDLFLRIEGPAAKRLTVYYDGLRRWMMAPRPRLRNLVHILSRRSEKSGPLRWLFSGPFRHISPMTRSIRSDLNKARRLDMIQAYFAPNWAMLRRIEAVERRGGDARIFTAAKSDNNVTVGAARHTYRRLLRRGVRLFEYQPQMLHVKLMVIDDAVYIGSANFDMRSFYINGEVMLRIEDAAFAQKMRAFVTQHEDWSEEITREKHRERSTAFARLRWLLSYFLVASVDHTVTRRLSLKRA